jgi:purine-binding chemotaxis protein CheW
MNKRYVSFSLAGGRYCVPVDQVLQILRLENLMEIPKAPPYVEGVVNLRGDIIPVVSLRQRLGIERDARGERREPDARKRRVVITRVGSRSYGLDVDEVREIVEIDDSSVSADATTMLGVRAEFVQGIARRDDSLYILLDLPRVFSAGRDLPAQIPGQP